MDRRVQGGVHFSKFIMVAHMYGSNISVTFTIRQIPLKRLLDAVVFVPYFSLQIKFYNSNKSAKENFEISFERSLFSILKIRACPARHSKVPSIAKIPCSRNTWANLITIFFGIISQLLRA